MLNTDDAGQDLTPTGEELHQPENRKAPAEVKSHRKRRILTVGAAVVLFVSGTAVGTTLPDPRQSQAYISLASEKAAVEALRDAALASHASVKGKYDTLQNGITTRESKVAAKEAEVGKADAAVKTAEAAVKAREEAVTGAEKTKAANTVGDGTWTVGTDIEPGTYRAAAAVGSTCYWGIYRSGSNGGDIIENDIPGGGRPMVTLSAGQDFNSTRCGKWEKQ